MKIPPPEWLRPEETPAGSAPVPVPAPAGLLVSPGLLVSAGRVASYSSPGMSGASSACISFTRALRGPQGLRTAHRSYRASMIRRAQAVHSSKWDSCQARMTEVRTR